MLNTPLGNIQLFVNDKEIPFTAINIERDDRCPNVNGRYLIQYHYKKEYKRQIIACCLPNLSVKGDIESGERLEAISFYKDKVKLTMAVEAEFEQSNLYDYNGHYSDNGIAYETLDMTEDHLFQFGVCWIEPCTEENNHQTWFGADPSLMRRISNDC